MLVWSVKCRKSFPLTLVPTPGKRTSVGDLQEWLQNQKHRDQLLEDVHSYGAVLFRGFDFQNAHDFSDFLGALHLEVMQPQEYTAHHQEPVVGNHVTASDERVAGEPISFHHELSNLPRSPVYVLLHCDTPPTDGGETPLVRGRAHYSKK